MTGKAKADAAVLYSMARCKVAPQIPLRYRGSTYDLIRDWYEVDVGLYAPVIVGAEEIYNGRPRIATFA